MSLQKRKHELTPTALVPIAVDVDLVRFEKNLLQIGFFGANDARDKNRTSVESNKSSFGMEIKSG